MLFKSSLPDRLFLTFKKKFENPTFQGAIWIFASRMLRIVLQAAYFLLIARSLGTEQYGTFIGVASLVKILLPFSAWGAPEILMKHVSRNPLLFSAYWGNGLAMIGAFGTLCLTLMLGFSGILLPPSATLGLMVCVGLADLFFSRVLDVALKAFMAMDLHHLNAKFHVLLTVNSVIAALCLAVLVPEPNVTAWGGLYLASRVVTMLMAFALIHRTIGKPKLVFKWIVPELGQGFFFSVDFSAYTLSSDLDKTMLARLGTLEATGIYGAAYRVIDVAIAPVMSLAAVAYAQFFRAGQQGVQGSLQVAKRFVPLAGGYGILASIGVFAIAPVVPYLLGSDYAAAVDAIRWLSPLLFLRSLQSFAADTLTGAGLQGNRTILQVSVALLNGVANWWLIPIYSWKGAAWASILADGTMLVGLWILVALSYREQMKAEGLKSS